MVLVGSTAEFDDRKKEEVDSFLVLCDLEACDVVLRDSCRVRWGLSGLSIARVISVCYTETVGVEACGR